MDDLKTLQTLVCASTFEELQCWPGNWKNDLNSELEYFSNGEIGFLVTEVGVPYTLKNLMMVLYENSPQKIINIGIAGAYPNSELDVGDVVVGDSEVFGDLGMEFSTKPKFKALSEFSFGVHSKSIPLQVPKDITPLSQFNFKIGKGNTVNTCTGTRITGEFREKETTAIFETMEGAAAAFAGDSLGIPVMEIRGISNIASDRNIEDQGIQKALQNLSEFLLANEKILI